MQICFHRQDNHGRTGSEENPRCRFFFAIIEPLSVVKLTPTLSLSHVYQKNGYIPPHSQYRKFVVGIDKFFKITERGSTIKTELLGGVTTFLTMAYIIVVNPAILAFAGFPEGPTTVATILAAVLGCLLMGLYANRPIAVAPYMGENAFIAFGLAALGIGWQQRLGAVFISGLAFLALSVFRLRPWLANSISPSLKYSFAAGIGLFLTFIGLYQVGIVTSAAKGMPVDALQIQGSSLLGAPPVPLKIGDWHDPKVLLAIFGFIVTCALLDRKVKGAVLIGIVLTSVIGVVLGYGEAPTGVFAMPFTGEYTLEPIFLKLDVVSALQVSFLPILVTLFLMSFLDTLATLIGVGAAGNMLDEKGNFEDIEKPMVVDAISCVSSSLIGTSTSGAYIESAAGIREGARTGFATVITALLFFASLFFLPLVTPFQKLSYAYAPALMAVGVLMLHSLKQIDMDDLTEAVPAISTIALMIFTYNTANGLTAGLVLFVLMKIASGRWKELNSGSYVLAAMCLVYFFFGLPH